MIALISNCMLFQLATGESVPFSSEMISIEVSGDTIDHFDPDVLNNAAASVFHYFKVELGREMVTIGEFAGALEMVLRRLGFDVRSGEPGPAMPEIAETDLGRLARESGENFELLFYPRLRGELRTQLQRAPRVVYFRGLRRCVKLLAGARRWSARCEHLQDQIVTFLRACLTAEPEQSDCALVVE